MPKLFSGESPNPNAKRIFTTAAKYCYFLPLALAVCQSIALITSYGISWQFTEVQSWKPHFVEWGFPKSFADLGHALNWRVFEYRPRVTRPLSDLFELYDTPFRSLLFEHMPLLPSFSLTWPFSILLNPLLLFLLLRRLKIEAWIATLAVSLYIANPGVMSLEAMLFRPGKAMTITAILLCLWIAARQNDSFNQGARGFKVNLRFAGLCVLSFISFFWDESALVIFPAIIVLFPRLVSHSKINRLLMTLLPAAYIVTIKLGMLVLSAKAGYPLVRHTYGPEKSMISFLTLHMSPGFYLQVLFSVAANMDNIILDSFGLIRPDLTHSLYYFCVFVGILGFGLACVWKQAVGAWKFCRKNFGTVNDYTKNFSIYAIVLLALLAGFVTSCLVALAESLRRSLRNAPGEILGDSMDAVTCRALLMLVIAFFYEGLLMLISTLVPSMRIWGLYYYGVFCVIFLLIALALLAQKIQVNRMLASCFVLAVIEATVFIFPATNQAYKEILYYVAPYYVQTRGEFRYDYYAMIFDNSLNRFDARPANAKLLEDKIHELWRSRTTHQSVFGIPVELISIIYELKFLSQYSDCTMPYFDLLWKGNVARVNCPVVKLQNPAEP